MAKSKSNVDELFSAEDVPEVCPSCGQRINATSSDQITHHQKPGHLPFSRAAKKTKRRWQAAP